MKAWPQFGGNDIKNGEKYNMNNITIGDVPYAFVDGTLKVQYAPVSFSYGQFPNNLNGSLQVTPDDGLSNIPTEEEIKKIALQKIQKLISSATSPEESSTNSAASSTSVE